VIERHVSAVHGPVLAGEHEARARRLHRGGEVRPNRLGNRYHVGMATLRGVGGVASLHSYRAARKVDVLFAKREEFTLDHLEGVSDAGAGEPVEAKQVEAGDLAGARVLAESAEFSAVESLCSLLLCVPGTDAVPSSGGCTFEGGTLRRVVLRLAGNPDVSGGRRVRTHVRWLRGARFRATGPTATSGDLPTASWSSSADWFSTVCSEVEPRR
jgi:hypothetical protein